MSSAPTDTVLTEAVRELGWSGVTLLETTLFGCRLIPVVYLDVDAHRCREASGDGPQRDADMLAIWEWPQALGQVPPPALSLAGVLLLAYRDWRCALADATRWRGFGPAAVLALDPEVIDQMWRWEFDLAGVGLVTTESSPDLDAPPSSTAVVPAEPGRRAPPRRRTADRWIEESLYQSALTEGLYSAPASPNRGR